MSICFLIFSPFQLLLKFLGDFLLLLVSSLCKIALYVPFRSRSLISVISSRGCTAVMVSSQSILILLIVANDFGLAITNTSDLVFSPVPSSGTLANTSTTGHDFSTTSVTAVCPPVEVPDHASILAGCRSASYGASCLLECNRGYSSNFNLDFFCGHNGLWHQENNLQPQEVICSGVYGWYLFLFVQKESILGKGRGGKDGSGTATLREAIIYHN